MKPMLSLPVLGFALIGLLCAAGGVAAATDTGPKEVTINRLANLFDAVTFDHAAHVEITGDCASCHHHTTGDGAGGGRCDRCHANSPKSANVGCGSCHDVDPFSAVQLERKADDRYLYHTDKPGLKAAYHWNCLGCHENSGGPTGCEDCHARNAVGDQFYHSGTYAPKAAASTSTH
jgi:hypothetical protein